MATSQRWALLLQYDGAEFAGSQWQPNLPTVQGTLQSAIAELTGTAPRVSFAGRTDAGVHALGQMASFVSEKSPEQMPAHRWVRGLNHFLPSSVAVQAAAAVTDDFDPRRDARSRTYVYRVRLANQRQPLWQARTWIVPGPFCLQAAQRALEELVGHRDFAPFTPPTDDRATLRTLREAAVQADGDTLAFRFRADSFLHHQVRRMVGAVVELATARSSLDEFRRALDRAVPGSMGPTAPACGLTLSEVEYVPPLFDQPANQPSCHRDREGV
ncbi:MAG: tRNA pseudouridine(38-40) synthase TruA [Chloroflexi bacterium]|nr:tRNA pseudouridine(38-40) synthase TruA [Chloroflexota bacterium]